nr:hypothetical protein [uncultured bacterium]
MNFYSKVQFHLLVYRVASVISKVHNASLINIFLAHYKVNFNKKIQLGIDKICNFSS